MTKNICLEYFLNIFNKDFPRYFGMGSEVPRIRKNSIVLY